MICGLNQRFKSNSLSNCASTINCVCSIQQETATNPRISKHPRFVLDCREFINRTDICAIQESWLRHKETVSIPNFKHFKANRKESKKAKRGSGGIILLYNDKLHKGISRQKSRDENHTIQIKCDKGYFGLKEDLYVVSAYFPPQNSQSSSNKTNCDTIFDKTRKGLESIYK